VRGGDSANCSQYSTAVAAAVFARSSVLFCIFFYFYFYQNAAIVIVLRRRCRRRRHRHYAPSLCSLYCIYSVCYTVAARTTNDPSASARGPLAIDSRCIRGARPPVQAFRFPGMVSPDTRYMPPQPARGRDNLRTTAR